MKKIYMIILSLLLFIPFVNVFAISCYQGQLTVGTSFTCSEIEGDSLTFKDNTTDEDYSNLFTYTLRDNGQTGKKEAQITLNSAMTFNENDAIRILKVIDGNTKALITIKNESYVEPTTITTTSDVNSKTITVTLDPNNNDEVTTKTCQIKNNEETCYITLPKIDNINFNGWGTAKTCKEGNSGSIKVNNDITYYACYKNNENTETTNKTLYIKSLKLSDEEGNPIEFGTFSIKKMEYKFDIANEIKKINVNAEVDEGIDIEIIGNEYLNVGENRILIKLKDDNNNTNIYTLIANKLEEGVTINKINYLKSLVVGGYEINFNKETFKYSLSIPNDIDKLAITAISENDENEVEILNNENLVNGSIITIKVTGDNDNTTTYIINITKESGPNYLLFAGIGLIIVLIIILMILIIIKRKKTKRTQPKNNNIDKIEVLNI